MPRTTCDVPIFDDIGYFGFSSAAAAAACKGEGDKLNVLINSRGGEIMEGLGVYNIFRAEAKKRPVNVTVMGVAASMASVIAMAGDEITMWDNSFMMLHNPQSFADIMLRGDAKDLRDAAGTLMKEADVLDFMKARLVGAYSRGGKVTQDLDAILDAETWMDAATCLAMGLCDKVIPPPKDQPTARLDLSRFARVPQAVRDRYTARTTVQVPSPGVSQTPQRSGATMADVKRIQATLMCVSGLLALAQEGATSEDAQEKTLFTGLAQALPPVAVSLQALLPAGTEALASLRDHLALREAVERETGEKTGHVGAVVALARNARDAGQVSERARVATVLDEMCRAGQIGPEDKAHYAGYTLVDAQAMQRQLRKAPLPQTARQGGDGERHQIDGTERPTTEQQAAHDRKVADIKARARAAAGGIVPKAGGVV